MLSCRPGCGHGTTSRSSHTHSTRSFLTLTSLSWVMTTASSSPNYVLTCSRRNAGHRSVNTYGSRSGTWSTDAGWATRLTGKLSGRSSIVTVRWVSLTDLRQCPSAAEYSGWEWRILASTTSISRSLSLKTQLKSTVVDQRSGSTPIMWWSTFKNSMRPSRSKRRTVTNGLILSPITRLQKSWLKHSSQKTPRPFATKTLDASTCLLKKSTTSSKVFTWTLDAILAPMPTSSKRWPIIFRN